METVNTIGIQLILRPAQIFAPANADAHKLQDYLERYKVLESSTGIWDHASEILAERLFAQWLKDHALEHLNEQERALRYRVFLGQHGGKIRLQALKALRVSVLWNHKNQPAMRKLASDIASSELQADFCQMLDVNVIRGCSKSSLDRLVKLFTAEDFEALHQTLTSAVFSAQHCEATGLQQPLNAAIAWIDGTCIEADIHYPVDWVLLADITRTFLQVLIRIRNKGILNRMPKEPKEMLADLNKLCIEITRTNTTKKGGKKLRKSKLRHLRNTLLTVYGHVEKHMDKLAQNLGASGLSQRQFEALKEHVQKYADQIDPAIQEVKERLLQEKKSKQTEKILSVHVDNVNVVVRGKAGKKVEFGNTCILAENIDGYVMGWKFYKEQAPAETRQAQDLITQLLEIEADTPLKAVVTDRGMNSKVNSKFLEENDLEDFTCSRSPKVLAERMEDPLFSQMQKRRACTEGRIGILKNAKMDGQPRSRTFENRNQVVASTIVCHNLWVLARLLQRQEKQLQQAA